MRGNCTNSLSYCERLVQLRPSCQTDHASVLFLHSCSLSASTLSASLLGAWNLFWRIFKSPDGDSDHVIWYQKKPNWYALSRGSENRLLDLFTFNGGKKFQCSPAAIILKIFRGKWLVCMYSLDIYVFIFNHLCTKCIYPYVCGGLKELCLHDSGILQSVRESGLQLLPSQQHISIRPQHAEICLLITPIEISSCNYAN